MFLFSFYFDILAFEYSLKNLFDSHLPFFIKNGKNIYIYILKKTIRIGLICNDLKTSYKYWFCAPSPKKKDEKLFSLIFFHDMGH